MKTLKTTLDGKTDQAAPQWIKVRVSHSMNAYLRLVMFCNFIIVIFNIFHIESRAIFKAKTISVTIMTIRHRDHNNNS